MIFKSSDDADNSAFEQDLVFQEVRDGFIAHLPWYIEEIKQSYLNADYPRLVETAHKLKGSSATFGLKKISEVSEYIERHGLESENHEIDRKLKLLDKLYRDVI